MAKKVQVELEILLKAAGIEPTTKQLKAMRTALEGVNSKSKKVSKSVNETYRNMRGSSEATGRANKDFGRMAQGMGGLVAVYATIAANVFALSSAFLVLRKAADLSSMIKSSEDFSNRFGVSVTSIAKRMQDASGGAISFAEALPTINKAISSGIGEEKLEDLTKAATKAAQTFGGSATEALNRFISASQRGRVEIIQTLGIVIKTEQAYKDYGATIGKTALELTALDRQQAILNATIVESKNVFDGVTIDPNPFSVMLKTVTDLKDVMLTFITDGLTPIISLFNQSTTAAGALIAILLSLVGKRLLPTIADTVQRAAVAGIASSKAARSAAIGARRKHAQAVLNIEQNSTKRSSTQLVKRLNLFRSFYSTNLKENKAYHQKILNEDGSFNRQALLNQQAQNNRELASRQKVKEGGKGFQNALPGIGNKAIQNDSNRIAVLLHQEKLVKGVKSYELAQTSATNTSKVFFATAQAGYAKVKSSIISATSALKTGFAGTFAKSQISFKAGITDMIRSWRILVRDVTVGSVVMGKHFLNLGKAAGRTAGVVAAAFTTALGAIGPIIFAVTTLTFLWSKYGDTLRGISPRMRELIDAGDDLAKSLEEIETRTAEGIVKLGYSVPDSLKKVSDALKFTAGTFDSITASIRRFEVVSTRALGNISVDEALTKMKALEQAVERMKEEQTKGGFSFDNLYNVNTIDEASSAMVQLNEETRELRNLLTASAEALETRLITALSTAASLAKKAGFANISGVLSQQLKKARKEGLNISTIDISTLANAAAEGNQKVLTETLARIKKGLNLSEEDYVRFVKGIKDVTTGFNSEISNVTTSSTQAIASLLDVGNKFTTFVGGLDKLRAASGPDKELAAFILDTTRALETLDKAQTGATKNTTLAEQIADPAQLVAIKQLLGFAKDKTVDLGTALERASEMQRVFAERQRKSATLANSIKISAIELNNIRQRVIRSDDARLKQLKDQLNVQKQLTINRLGAARLNVEAQNQVIDALDQEEVASEAIITDAYELLAVYNKQVSSLEERQRVQAQNIDVQKQILKFRLAEISASSRVNKIQKQTATSQRQISANSSEDLTARRAILAAQKKDLKLQVQKNKAQQDYVETTTIEGASRERGLAPLREELLLIEQKTKALERQNLLIQARELDDEVFSAEGAEIVGQVFSRELRDGVRNLEPTLVSLGKGFAGALTGTIDAAVDKLLEGHGFSGFAHAVTESLKDGLREAFGNTIKDQIKVLFSDLFPETAAEKALKAQEANTTATVSLTQAMGGGGVGSTGSGTGSGRISTEGLTLNAEGKPIVAAVQDVVSELAKNGEESKTSFGSFFSLMTTVISSLGGGTSSAISGIGGIIGSIFGAANGAVTTGLQVPGYAKGAITTKPQLAMIGEGKNREAVVPLPNNREIPVDLRGNQGDTFTIENNYDFTNADANTISQLRNETGLIEERVFNRVFSEMNKGGKYAKMSGRR
jgi:hypothetical protein